MESSLALINVKQCIEQLRQLNPDYKYYYFTAYDCREFIAKEFPEILQYYDLLLPGAYKADLWRYCVLHRYGGIYLDIGVMPYVGFRTFLHPSTEFLSSVDLRHTDLYQAILGARSQHPALQYAIDECVTNVKQRTLGEGALEITGPAVMGRALNRFLERLPEDNLHPYADKMNVQLLRWDSLKTVKDLVWNDLHVACHKYTKRLSKAEADLERKRWLVLSGKLHYGILYAQQQVYPRQLFEIKH
jgi:mannosyltransferase OCH1-like enzyme